MNKTEQMNYTEQKYYEVFKEQARRFPGKPAIVMGEKRLSYSELIRKIEQVASFLVEHGVKSKDHIVLWAGNCPEWLYVYYGIIHAGAVAVCLNNNYTIDDVTPLVTFADSKYVFFGSTHDTKGESAESEVLAQSFGIPKENVFSIFEADFNSAQVREINDSRDVRDDAYIIYTSGTTSFPKAVLSSQYSMINLSLRFASELKPLRGNSACVALPLFHAFGLSVPCIYLSLGGTVYLPESRKPQDIADIVSRNRITDLWSVAAVYQSIIDNREYIDKCAPFIRMCAIAGSYTSPVQFTRFEAALNHATFLNMFGMTETATVFIMVRPSDDLNVRYNTIGKKVPGVEIGIYDEQKGILPAGEVGELVTRGFHVKNGYYKLPEEKQAVDKDGWFHTGDLGVMDDEGNVRIMGRIKDIIIKGGENITPGEIEAEALNVPGIKECKVFGYKDRLYGENLGACLTLEEGSKFDEELTRTLLRKKIGSFKVPAYFFTYDSFPLNATGKVDQRSLHMDMLKRLRVMELGGELEQGIPILSLIARNSSFNIMPIVAAIEELAIAMDFGSKRRRVRHAVEEMLSERIVNAYEDVGDIHVQCTCFRDYLRLSFMDNGQLYDFDKQRKQNISARIMASAVDDISITRSHDSSRTSYNFDFLYDKDFDIKEFVASHERLM